MKVGNKFLLFILFLFILNNSYSQSFEFLKIDDEKDYGKHLLFRNVFGTYEKAVLFNSQAYVKKDFSGLKNIYYVLDVPLNSIKDFTLDTSYLPLSFLNNDTIVLRNIQNENHILYSFSQKKFIYDIDKSLCMLLRLVPKGIDSGYYLCKFNAERNRLFFIKPEFNSKYKSSFILCNYNISKDTIEQQTIDLNNFNKTHMINNIFWVDSSRLLIHLFHPQMKEICCIYQIDNKKITVLKLPDNMFFEDYCNGYCILAAVNGYNAGIYHFDVNKSQFVLKHRIVSEGGKNDYLDILGFVSPSKIARMGAAPYKIDMDLNQKKNLFDISVIYVR